MTAAQKTAKDKFKKAIAYRQKTGVSLKEAFAHIYGKKIANTRKLVFDYLEVPKGKVPKIVKVIGNIENATYKILGISIGFKKEIDKETGLYIIQVLDLSNNKKIIPISNNSDSKEVAYDLTEYIKYYTNTPTNIKSYGVLKKLEALVPKIKKEVQNLNKKSTKMPIKNKVVKKSAPKKVIRKVIKKKAAPKKIAKKKLTKQDYDKRYQAKKPGKRTSASGNTYYESRPNRSDKGKLLGIEGNLSMSLIKRLEGINKEIEQRQDVIANVIQNKTYFVNKNGKSWYPKFMKLAKSHIAELKKHKTEIKKLV